MLEKNSNLVNNVKKLCEFRIAVSTHERKLLGEILESIDDTTRENFNTAVILAGGTEEEIAILCKAHGFKKRQTDFCIAAFGLNALSEIELADKFQIEVQSAKNKKQYYKKKLIFK